MTEQYRKIRFYGLGVGVAAIVVAVLAAAAINQHATSARAWTASSGYGLVSAGSSDAWYNYDFATQSESQGNVDWPVRFLFHTDAEIDLVKNTADGCNGDPTIFPCLDDDGGAKHFRGRDGSWYWDDDSGIKQELNCELDQHMRVYAPEPADYGYDPELGNYVLGTVHKDYEGSGCANKYYSAEGEESWWNSRFDGIPGWSANEDVSYWSNYESALWADTSHWVQSNGYASYITVP